uniref:Uncharacterized protein n=1 Tax=Gorilla gorilla gorilla TaxID=9595 RepID=A0A2I2ZWD2_GORGO
MGCHLQMRKLKNSFIFQLFTEKKNGNNKISNSCQINGHKKEIIDCWQWWGKSYKNCLCTIFLLSSKIFTLAKVYNS